MAIRPGLPAHTVASRRRCWARLQILLDNGWHPDRLLKRWSRWPRESHLERQRQFYRCVVSRCTFCAIITLGAWWPSESMEWVGSSPTAAPTISMNVPGYAFFAYLVILTLLFTTLALLAVLAWRKAVTSFAVAAKAAALLKIPNARKLSATIIFRTWQMTLILQVGAAVTQLGMPYGGGFLLFMALLWFFGYCFGVFAVITHLVCITMAREMAGFRLT